MVFSGRLQLWRPLLRWGAGVGVAGLLSISAVQAREQAPALPPVAVSALPAEAQSVELAIRRGAAGSHPHAVGDGSPDHQHDGSGGRRRECCALSKSHRHFRAPSGQLFVILHALYRVCALT